MVAETADREAPGPTQAEIEQMARDALRDGMAAVTERVRVSAPRRVCRLCGDTGRIADDIPCWLPECLNDA